MLRWSWTRARLATMALFAAEFPISALGVMAEDLWTAVTFISIATACHQAWSANMFTVASDAFPTRAAARWSDSAACAAASAAY